ncbi:MAG: hypothetical protein H0W17_03770 [Chloroflexi bacterium]|nr:hypothetical protein [Chloroflexota bacterium]
MTLLGVVELGDEALHRAVVLQQSAKLAGRLTAHDVQKWAQGNARVGEQRSEREMRVEEQAGGGCQTPADELTRDPSRRLSTHVTCAR